MRRAVFVVILLTFLSMHILTPIQAYGWSWPWSADPMNMDVRFKTVYPPSFWSSTMGKIVKYTGIAAIAFAITYFTAGTGTAASAGIIAQFIGGTIGSWMGLSGIAALNAGLAFLGGGAVAAGGLGILGGVSVVSAVSSVALTAVSEVVAGQIPAGTHGSGISLIRPKLFFDLVSPAVKEEMKELKSALDDIAKGGGEAKAKRVTQLLNQIDRKLSNEVAHNKDETTAYNYLLLAIIRYNMKDFVKAKEAADRAYRFVDMSRSSVVDYVEALLAFANNDENTGKNLLEGIIRIEPEAATPYIVLAQVHMDNHRYNNAFNVLDRGLNETSDEVCVMSWMAGNSLYTSRRYGEAITYYKKALSNMTINEFEALYKLNIAKCYQQMGNIKEGKSWLDDAISEVSDKQDMVESLRKQYYSAN